MDFFLSSGAVLGEGAGGSETEEVCCGLETTSEFTGGFEAGFFGNTGDGEGMENSDGEGDSDTGIEGGNDIDDNGAATGEENGAEENDGCGDGDGDNKDEDVGGDLEFLFLFFLGTNEPVACKSLRRPWSPDFLSSLLKYYNPQNMSHLIPSLSDNQKSNK